MKISCNYLLHLCLFLVCIWLDSCQPKPTDTIVSPSPTTTAKSFFVSEIKDKQKLLGAVTFDSTSKELRMIYGKKNDDGSLHTVTDYFGLTNDGYQSSMKFTETTFFPVEYTINYKGEGIRFEFLAVSMANSTLDLNIIDIKTGQKLSQKAYKLDVTSIEKLSLAEKVYKDNLKSARVSSVACSIITALEYITEDIDCVLSSAEVIKLYSQPLFGLGPLLNNYLLPRTVGNCKQALTNPIYNPDCQPFPITTKALLESFIIDCGESIHLGVPQIGCINAGAQLILRLLSNFLSQNNKQTTSPSSSGGAFGDPHLQTFDGLYYDFQGYGEFIALKSLTDNFEIQVRQEQLAPYLNRQVTVHTGIAINTGNDKVCVYPDRIYINTKQYGFGNVVVPLTKGSVSYSNGVVAILTDNEDVIKINIQSLSPSFLDYKVVLNSNRKGKVKGMLGNFDGVPGNDTQLQTGGAVNPSTFGDLYPAYADSWRVSQDKSLFVYVNGTSTATYTKKDFPKSQTEIDAAARLQAETICRQQGITEEPYFSACVMDVALAGSDRYAISAVGAEESKLLINNFNIATFSSFEASDLTLHGNVEIADGLMYLTRAAGNQSAAVYKKYKIDISNGFETAFDFSMTQPGGIQDARKRVGADGLVFVIQDYGSKIIPPSGGLGLGYDGLPRSLAIEFDTFDDLYYGIKESPDDIWLNTQGINANSADDNRTLIRPQTRPLPVMNDGKIHHVVIRYTKKGEGIYKLEVFFDNNSMAYLIADTINIQKTIGAYGTGVYIGLTASTGAGWENHIIHNWSFKPLQ